MLKTIISKVYFKKFMLFILVLHIVACNFSSKNAKGYVVANSKEPTSLLIPAEMNDVYSTRIGNLIFSGLVYYDENGNTKLDIAESINTEDNKNYIVKIKDNVVFTDGSEIKAHNFVNAWNLAIKNKLRESSYLHYIKGYPENNQKDFTGLSGLKIIDDKTFSIELKDSINDFKIQLGQLVFFPLPDIAFKSLNKFGKNPIGNGPYKLSTKDAWIHNESITLIPNKTYQGPRKTHNKGIKFVFYPKLSGAYADLLSGQLDVLDNITDENIFSADQDLNHRIIIKPTARLYSIEINTTVTHFRNDKEGRLRRKAISMAINRKEIADIIFKGLKIPATDFTSPIFAGFNPNIKGNQVLGFHPKLAKKLWTQADKLSKFNTTFTIAYNFGNDDKVWVDAVCNQLRNNLGIKVQGLIYADYKNLLEDQKQRKIKLAAVRQWTGDYPSLLDFLDPVFSTIAIGGKNKSGTNNTDYSNANFDDLMYKASVALTLQDGYNLTTKSQEILLNDLPAIPLWYVNSFMGFSSNVTNVKVDWIGEPIYYLISK